MAPLEEFCRGPSDKNQMERLLKHHDKESMKTSILNQEAIFRQQVQELHRVYRVQKQLMRNLKEKEQNLDQRIVNDTGYCQSHFNHKDKIRPNRTFDLELAPEEYIRNNEENDLELTLATGCRQKKRGNGLYNSDSGTSFSSSSTDSCGVLQMPELRSHISSKTKSSFGLQEEKRKERFLDQPPWSLPCLSLKIG